MLTAMTIGQRIQTARTRLDISQSELARRLGLRAQSVQNWEAGKNEPRGRRLHAIAQELGVTKQYLLGLQDEVEQAPSPSRRAVPIISMIEAGNFREAIDLYQPGDGEDWITPDKPASRYAFGLRVTGDSMISTHGGKSYPPGTIIIVDPEKPADPGRRVVAKHVDSGEATFKELAQDAGKFFLKPLNTQYPMLHVDGEWQIVGVVIGSYQPE